MSLQRSFIEDAIDVIREIRLIAPELKMGQKLATIRKEAVGKVANRELARRRFSNFDSAYKSIHDACSRRLYPSVTNIGDFDGAVERWLTGNPEPLRSILLPKADYVQQRDALETILRKSDSHPITPFAVDIDEPTEAQRIKVETYRILRDTALAREIKGTHKYKCQICGQILMIGDKTPYAEAHHIKPLGVPHNGPDESGNIICVCPNCHVLLDYGGIRLVSTQLNSTGGHNISMEYIDYHNAKILNRVDVEG